MRNLNIGARTLLIQFAVFLIAFGFISEISASDTSNFQQVINSGTLSIDIVNSSYVPVASPSVTFPAATYSLACQDNNATFGTDSERIYIQNPSAAPNGWVASLAASATTAVWTGTTGTYDFNDTSGAGCTDGVDADSVGGQMAVDPSVGTLQIGTCSGCVTTNITKGSSTAFNQGTVDSITLLTASSESDDTGDWRLTGVAISQTIPAEQPAAADYDIDMVLSIVSN